MGVDTRSDDGERDVADNDIFAVALMILLQLLLILLVRSQYDNAARAVNRRGAE